MNMDTILHHKKKTYTSKMKKGNNARVRGMDFASRVSVWVSVSGELSWQRKRNKATPPDLDLDLERVVMGEK